MTISKWVIFKQRLIHLVYRILNRLRFFPFTLAFFLLNATLKVVHLRWGRAMVKVGEARRSEQLLPSALMLWLDRTRGQPPACQYDLCLLLPKTGEGANLQDLFSVLVTSARPRSIGFYWDAEALKEDLPLLQARQEAGASYEQLGSPEAAAMEHFLRNDDRSLVLPVAAVRDAQTLLKRQAGAALAVCINLPTVLMAAMEALTRERPDLQFFDLSTEGSDLKLAANHFPLGGSGFGLHERMALVQAADGYVGLFDELGCVAVASRRPAALCGGSPSAAVFQHGNVGWWGSPGDGRAFAEASLQFLSRHLPGEGAPASRVPGKRAAGDAV